MGSGDNAFGSCHLIDLVDTNEDVDKAELQILHARGKRNRKKFAKCWEHFKLINMGCIVD